MFEDVFTNAVTPAHQSLNNHDTRTSRARHGGAEGKTLVVYLIYYLKYLIKY